MSHDVLDALQTSRAWINYAPAKPFDMVIGKNPATEDLLRTDLELLRERGFRGLVTNTMTYGCEATPRIAKELGFEHVIAKLWWTDDPTLETEKANLAQEIEHVDAIVVGNETVHKAAYRSETVASAVERLHAEITALQSAYGKPVSTGLHRDDWAANPEIATEFGDFVFANLQPWWVQHRNVPEAAADWVTEVLGVIGDTPGMPADRPIFAQEAAFPSGSFQPEAAPGATPENQRIFYERLIAGGAHFVYGFAFDAYFAVKGSPPGGFGGLWDADRNPKPAVEILDLGDYGS